MIVAVKRFLEFVQVVPENPYNKKSSHIIVDSEIHSLRGGRVYLLTVFLLYSF